MACEEHWPGDYAKVIYYDKEQPRDPSSNFSLSKDPHVRIAMVQPVCQV